jgi:F0F1-type ATP synthase membrane subunit b/b'
LADLYQQSVELATKLSAKTLGRNITADDHRRLLDESVAELKQSAKT